MWKCGPELSYTAALTKQHNTFRRSRFLGKTNQSSRIVHWLFSHGQCPSPPVKLFPSPPSHLLGQEKNIMGFMKVINLLGESLYVPCTSFGFMNTCIHRMCNYYNTYFYSDWVLLHVFHLACINPNQCEGMLSLSPCELKGVDIYWETEKYQPYIFKRRAVWIEGLL